MSRNYLDEIKSEIINSLFAINVNWDFSEIRIEFPPFTNKGYSETLMFFDKNCEKVRILPKFSEKFEKVFFDFWYETKDKYNEIVFKTKKDDYENAMIEARFNQEVEDNFQNNLPKSKRGKTTPWWENEKYKKE